MATHAYIGRVHPRTGQIEYIYLHQDGAPTDAGRKLVEHYNTSGRVELLLELGDIASIGPEIGTKFYFHDHNLRAARSQVQCVAYTRDRGDASTTRIAEGVFPILEAVGPEYFYLWAANCWWFIEPKDPRKRHQLTPEFCDEWGKSEKWREKYEAEEHYFHVHVKERWTATYLVKAKTEEEALGVVRDGGGERMDEEWEDTLQSDTWEVEEVER